MKKLLLVILLATSCINYKDIAQAQANVYEQSVNKTLALHHQQKVELYIQRQINRFFSNSSFENDTPWVELFDVSILEQEVREDSTVYECSIIMFTETNPYVLAHMTVEVKYEFGGLGQFTMSVDPWE